MIVRWAIMAVVAILVVAGFVAYSHLGGAVKSIIESAGSQAMGTKVSVSGLDVSVASETASINGLTVANPHGFGGDVSGRQAGTAVGDDDIDGGIGDPFAHALFDRGAVVAHQGTAAQLVAGGIQTLHQQIAGGVVAFIA